MVKMDIRQGVLNNFIMKKQLESKRFKLENVLNLNIQDDHYIIDDIQLDELEE